VFIGAALDRSFTPSTSRTGARCGRGRLPERARRQTMSYRLASGEPVVSDRRGGGGAWGAGDSVVRISPASRVDFGSVLESS